MADQGWNSAIVGGSDGGLTLGLARPQASPYDLRHSQM